MDDLPPHITEDDIRLIAKIITPTIAGVALRDAAHSGYFGTSAQSTLLRMAERYETTPKGETP